MPEVEDRGFIVYGKSSRTGVMVDGVLRTSAPNIGVRGKIRCARDADTCIMTAHGWLLSTRPTSLRRSFLHAIKRHHEIIRGAQRFQGAVLDSIETLATRRASRY